MRRRRPDKRRLRFCPPRRQQIGGEAIKNGQEAGFHFGCDAFSQRLTLYNR